MAEKREYIRSGKLIPFSSLRKCHHRVLLSACRASKEGSVVTNCKGVNDQTCRALPYNRVITFLPQNLNSFNKEVHVHLYHKIKGRLKTAVLVLLRKVFICRYDKNKSAKDPSKGLNKKMHQTDKAIRHWQ